jgi:hypothetical protein
MNKKQVYFIELPSLIANKTENLSNSKEKQFGRIASKCQVTSLMVDYSILTMKWMEKKSGFYLHFSRDFFPTMHFGHFLHLEKVETFLKLKNLPKKIKEKNDY